MTRSLIGSSVLAEDRAFLDPAVLAVEAGSALDADALAEGPVAGDDQRLGVLERRHPGREALVEVLDDLVVPVEVDERATSGAIWSSTKSVPSS